MFRDLATPRTPRPPQQTYLARCAEKGAATTDLAVWVAWGGDEAQLRRSVAQFGTLQQHSLLSLTLINQNAGLWRCGFAYVGRHPDRSDHQHSLLRRISTVAPWVRIERLDPVSVGGKVEPDSQRSAKI